MIMRNKIMCVLVKFLFIYFLRYTVITTISSTIGELYKHKRTLFFKGLLDASEGNVFISQAKITSN